MFAFLLKLLLIARTRLKSRANLEADNLVLRQQVIILSRKSRSRVRLRNTDRLTFVWLYRCFPAILNAITVVKPETVIRWPSARLSGVTSQNLIRANGEQGADLSSLMAPASDGQANPARFVTAITPL
jgi:hypothetical protein